MKKLFLASSFSTVAQLFSAFEKDLAGKTVTFIPTASLVEKVVFYVKAGKKALSALGLTVDELEISTASPDEIKTKLAANDFIYLSGGNTFFLLQELKRTGADKLLAQHVQAGKLYIGESAGAMVASPNAEYAAAMDSMKKAPGLTDYASMGLVDFYTVPHCANAPFRKAAQKMIDTYSATLPLTPISNNEAITVLGGQVEIRRG